MNNVEDDRNRKRRSETEVSKLESKKKRCRKIRKINSKKTKASIAYRTFQKKRKKQILHSKRVEIMNNIERYINHVLAILLPKSQFVPILNTIKRNFVFIDVPEYCVKKKQQSKNSTDTNLPEENEFVLIMLSSNEKNKVKPQYLWTKEYGDQVYENMRANISCSETNEKHHGLNGKYFGFGLISKYALQKNLSINTFAGNNAHNSEIRSTLREKLHVLMNNQQNVLPLSLFCGFLLTN